MSTTQTASPAAVADRAEVEDFLYYEAELLDDWELESWRALFTPDCRYLVPSTDNPHGDPDRDLALIDDDAEGIRGRVQRLRSTWAHIENPRSITTRFISNVRVRPGSVNEITVRCAVQVHRARLAGTTSYVADLHYVLRRTPDGLRIASKRAVLGHSTLRDVGGVLSIVL
ncbi:hypothetical protein AD006_28390 (plasmid) [Pseudonocardia sp. EC080610-09]|uniref:aromatic-ring-hydroxylating dioxygenase subunit beta n=1 Tax=unclassified Pseudonocardia TaxID=2619320 RepID=UPI0007066D7C|nr:MULTISPECIES: aromatic-ring-hydroxylating dioxygenase subunit beta [unclassified Pseudonocardia]ALL79255.1 hypothetical protein AD006_28390 [Pseudonocardia sp. EC080610-09]ALL85225.1 hypothetical protein AD017_28780 [Pseudonocardia sp. EC080619-01]